MYPSKNHCQLAELFDVIDLLLYTLTVKLCQFFSHVEFQQNIPGGRFLASCQRQNLEFHVVYHVY